MCKLFGVNYTIHNINYSRNSKNSFRITEVRGQFVLLTCMSVTYVKVKLHSISIYMNFITCHRGGSRILKRGGGAQFCYCEHGNCVQSTQSGMQSVPNLGGSGGMPPQKILKN